MLDHYHFTETKCECMSKTLFGKKTPQFVPM
jgi:hypothetical protein